jgi:hypothetical protein
MLRSFLLALCLLIGLACATPFALDSLEEGMTTETVREKFGEPEAIETKPGGVEPSWTYLHEDQAWSSTIAFSSLFLPHCIIMSPLVWLDGEHWCFRWYVKRKPVVLQFVDGKLASWEVLPDPRGSFWDQQSDGSRWPSSSSHFQREMEQQMNDFIIQQQN